MLHKVVSVRDSASQLFGRPFVVVALGQATRAFSDEVNGQSEISRHPGDFELWEIGEFDDQTGMLVARHPQLVVRGKDLVSKE